MADGEAAESATIAAPETAGGRRPYLLLTLAWLLPGAGHVLLGRRARGLAFSAIVLVTLVVGCLLHGNLHRIVPGQPLTILATLGTMGVGAPYFVLRLFFGYEGQVVTAGYEYGSAFILTAGLMNLLLILDVWDIVKGRKG